MCGVLTCLLRRRGDGRTAGEGAQRELDSGSIKLLIALGISVLSFPPSGKMTNGAGWQRLR